MVKNKRLQVSLKNLKLNTPLLTASGTSGSSGEILALSGSDALLNSLGAFVTKGVSLKPRKGNPEIRVIETTGGLLNSIGLQNSGAQDFIDHCLPTLVSFRLPIIVNISASSVDEFGELTSFLMEHDENNNIAGLELNVSCPNIKDGGIAFGTNPEYVERIVKTARKAARDDIFIVTKLTPNISDITVPAKAAIAGGSDAISMINTVRGIAIDIEKRRPALGNVIGGLSGSAIKPIGLAMVWQCFKNIPECRDQRIPIIGLGGISDWRDALEYIMAGASAVAIGTAWFINNKAFTEIRDGLSIYMAEHKTSVAKTIGAAHL